MKYFYSSFIVTAIGLIVAFLYGGMSALFIVAILSVLEVSVSFDNAVKNAAVLRNWDEKWQQRFITWGILIAVFGMRFVFPILIVMIATGLGAVEALDLAMNRPEEYKHHIEASIDYIYSFGGAFLLMVGLEFFFDEDKEFHWLNIIENNKVMDRISKMESVEVVIALAIGIVLTYFTQDYNVSIAYFAGVILYALLKMLDDSFSADGVKGGIFGFLYLEVIDASFSFDGVIGAFAITVDIYEMMIGLGIGAMFVRSLTIYFVKKGTLSEYRYLEHGAHYAIMALAIIMFVKIFTEIPEVITGSIGMGFIVWAFIASVHFNKKNPLIDEVAESVSDETKENKEEK